MKLLYTSSREVQRNWFGKRGNSYLGLVFIYKLSDTDEDIYIEYHDFFSEDNNQDCYFVCSGM